MYQFCPLTFTEEDLSLARNHGLALFDFDGTITKKDSFELFIINTCGSGSNLAKDLLKKPKLLVMLLGFYLNIVSSSVVTENFMQAYLKGLSMTELQALAIKYLPELKAIIKPEALARIDWHRKQKHLIVIVSATPKMLLEPWCKEVKLKLIASELALEKNIITGKFDRLECNGVQKVISLEEKIGSIKHYPSIYAYGNSKQDLPMLRLAPKDKRFLNCLS